MPGKQVYDPVSKPKEVRAKCARMLFDTIGDQNVARLLERASWNHAVLFCKRHDQPLAWDNASFRNAYTQKILGVRYVAREKPDVLQKHVDTDPTLRSFVDAKPWELWPEKWASAFEEASRKELRFSDADSGVDPEKLQDGLIQCRCGSRKTSYVEKQTRSADESMTVFAKCHTCGKRWKS